MYKGYLFSSEGQYHAPVYLDEEQIMPFVFRYRAIAPKVMITNTGDESVLEAERGEIVWPEFNSDVIDQYNRSYPSMDDTSSLDELSMRYNDLVVAYKESSGGDHTVYQSMVHIENDMFALAARYNVSLSSFGWLNSGIIEAEVEAAKY